MQFNKIEDMTIWNCQPYQLQIQNACVYIVDQVYFVNHVNFIFIHTLTWFSRIDKFFLNW